MRRGVSREKEREEVDGYNANDLEISVWNGKWPSRSKQRNGNSPRLVEGVGSDSAEVSLAVEPMLQQLLAQLQQGSSVVEAVAVVVVANAEHATKT